MGYRLCRRPLLYDLQDVPTALTITSTLWDCHFQHLSLVLPPSLSLSLPVSLSLSSRLLVRVRVCRPVCTFARASACMCARASACTRGCGCFPAVSGRLRPSPAVSSRLRPSPALRMRVDLLSSLVNCQLLIRINELASKLAPLLSSPKPAGQ